MWEHCEHPYSQLYLIRQRNDAKIYKYICGVCWQAVSGAVKFRDLSFEETQEAENITTEELEIHRQNYGDQQRERFQAQQEQEAQQRERERKQKLRDWWQHYNSYLESSQWQNLRTQILQRDHYLCQGCLQKRADHVHHRSYAHVGQELAFELVSLCESCHRHTHDDGPAWESAW